MDRYILSCMISDVQVGTIFTKWPLHITIVPWFFCQRSIQPMISDIRNKLVNFEVFNVRVNESAMFGPNKDVPVKLVGKSPELKRLHAILYHTLLANGCDPEKEEYNTASYTPHITVRGDRNIDTGIVLQIKSVDILKDLKDGHMSRQIIERINFGEKN